MGVFPVAVRMIMLEAFLFVTPVLAGGVFCSAKKPDRKAGNASIPFLWVSGQMLLWAVFQILCVPMIILQKNFKYVESGFGIIAGILSCLGLGCLLYRNRRERLLRIVKEKDPDEKKGQLFLWTLFAGLLLFQLIQAVCMTYGDGDDAYYVTVSSITESGGTMYQILPYTGGYTEVDIRHGLAPFPIWIAFLAKMSGLKAVSVAHVAVPVMLIPMTYAIFYLLGSRLFWEKRTLLPLFMIFTELLVIFGDYSLYSMENFMIARSRQGKAAFGSIVIPMLFFLLLLLFEKIQQKQKCGFSFWLLLFSVMTAGCLCTTVGTFLECVLVGVAGLCGAVAYRCPKVLMPLAVCCTPCFAYALLYLANG